MSQFSAFHATLYHVALKRTVLNLVSVRYHFRQCDEGGKKAVSEGGEVVNW